MILSSADILRVLGADAIVRQAARLSIVEGRPGLDTGDSVYIYVDKYPTVDEFEAIWKIWVIDNSGMGEYVVNAMSSLLPGFEFEGKFYTTRDFASERTVVKTEAEKQLEQLAVERQGIKEDFSGLQKGLQERLSSVRDGRDGKDGRDGLDGRSGKDGRDGQDGRDIEATETDLFDLRDVEESLIPLEKGQVLTWDGSRWTNLFVPQILSSGRGGGGDSNNNDNGGNNGGNNGGSNGGSGIEEAPLDGNYYVRSDGAWINLISALDVLGYSRSEVLDGGDFTNGTSDATDNALVDGGDFR